MCEGPGRPPGGFPAGRARRLQPSPPCSRFGHGPGHECPEALEQQFLQLGILLGGFTPTIQAALAGKGTAGWIGPAAFAAAMCLIAAISTWTAKETSSVSIDDLDVDLHPLPPQAKH